MREKGAHNEIFLPKMCALLGHRNGSRRRRRLTRQKMIQPNFLLFHLLCAQSENWCWNNKKKSEHVHRRRPNGNETVTFNLSDGERLAEMSLCTPFCTKCTFAAINVGFSSTNRMEERNLLSHGCLYTAHPPPLVAHRRYLFTHYFHLVRLAASYVGIVHDRQRDSRSLRALDFRKRRKL